MLATLLVSLEQSVQSADADLSVIELINPGKYLAQDIKWASSPMLIKTLPGASSPWWVKW